MENLGLGLTLMAIGMVTVFAILLIVINLSNALIKIVTKFAQRRKLLRRRLHRLLLQLRLMLP